MINANDLKKLIINSSHNKTDKNGLSELNHLANQISQKVKEGELCPLEKVVFRELFQDLSDFNSSDFSKLFVLLDNSLIVDNIILETIFAYLKRNANKLNNESRYVIYNYLINQNSLKVRVRLLIYEDNKLKDESPNFYAYLLLQISIENAIKYIMKCDGLSTSTILTILKNVADGTFPMNEINKERILDLLYSKINEKEDQKIFKFYLDEYSIKIKPQLWPNLEPAYSVNMF
jgi:hypothetical protein